MVNQKLSIKKSAAGFYKKIRRNATDRSRT